MNKCYYCSEKLEDYKFPVCVSCMGVVDQLNGLIVAIDNIPVYSPRSRKFWLKKLPVSLCDKVNEL